MSDALPAPDRPLPRAAAAALAGNELSPASLPQKTLPGAEMADVSPPRDWIRDSVNALRASGKWCLALVHAALAAINPAWILSLLVHTAVVLLLALWVLPASEPPKLNELMVARVTTEEPLDELHETRPQEPEREFQVDLAALEAPAPSRVELAIDTPQPVADVAPAAFDAPEVGVLPDLAGGLLAPLGGGNASGLMGRSAASRAALVRAGGGNAGSEEAVALALRWLAEHQLPDGSWSLDQRRCPRCRGRCRDQGALAEMTNAATALALLPFLGAGQTHQEGDFQPTVRAGLAYLDRKMVRSRYRHRNFGNVTHGDLTDPGHGMYSHGLAAIALSEAYGMTRDRKLRDTAQLAVNFCITAQDRTTGGWGYTHGAGHDTSVAGWQIMALKSARMGYLDVPDLAFKRSFRFLDSVQANDGSHYGYREPGTGPATSAVGLLCRMYMGWRPNNEALARGVESLAALGPSPTNMYFNYYATQVLFQATEGRGPVWEKWNTELRDQLINTQSREAHERGSWNQCTYVAQGGRLYATSLSTMCLEVYYRHMPIYREGAATGDAEFPLD